MLKLSLKPGEYIDIGENIRVVFSGGSANNIHLLVDAPREYNIVRSNSMKQKDKKEYYREQTISEEAKREIAEILMREKHAASEITDRPFCRQYTRRLSITKSMPRDRFYYMA